jgi:hypothetical protein
VIKFRYDAKWVDDSLTDENLEGRPAIIIHLCQDSGKAEWVPIRRAKVKRVVRDNGSYYYLLELLSYVKYEDADLIAEFGTTLYTGKLVRKLSILKTQILKINYETFQKLAQKVSDTIAAKEQSRLVFLFVSFGKINSRLLAKLSDSGKKIPQVTYLFKDTVFEINIRSYAPKINSYESKSINFIQNISGDYPTTSLLAVGGTRDLFSYKLKAKQKWTSQSKMIALESSDASTISVRKSLDFRVAFSWRIWFWGVIFISIVAAIEANFSSAPEAYYQKFFLYALKNILVYMVLKYAFR